MSHVRQQIRDQVTTTLTGLTTTGTNVYETRVYPLESSSLPGLTISTPSEEIDEELSSGSRTIFRNLQLVIMGYAQATSDFDNTIDTIAAEVETALMADLTLNNLAKDTLLQSIETEFSTEGNKPVGTITMTFNVMYATDHADPTVAL